MNKKVRLALELALLAIVVAFGISFLTSSLNTDAHASSTITTQHKPLDLSGHWKQIKSGIPDSAMDATIKNGEIQVNVTMKSNDPSRTDVSGLYWAGTFNSDGDNLSPFSVTSVGDTGAMSEAMFGSEDSSKVFYYNNGVLSFPFSMMSVSTTVQLSRS